MYRAFPPVNTIAEIIRRMPEHADAPAFQFFNGMRVLRWSYIEVYDLALRALSLLREQGIRRGDRAMLCAPNGPEWGVVFLACALDGIILVPIDLRHEDRFIELVARESEPKVLICTRNKAVRHRYLPTLEVEGLLDRLSAFPPATLPDPPKPDDLLEIAYTSGTTGTPKGVMLTQGNLAANVTDVGTVTAYQPNSHFLSVLPLSHLFEQTGGFWTPLAGGAVITWIYDLRGSVLSEALRRARPNLILLVPRLLESLKEGISARFTRARLGWYIPGLITPALKWPKWLRKILFFPVHLRIGWKFRFFVSGGAALSPEVDRFWRGLGFHLLQGYGLTETAPVLAVTRPEDDRPSSSVGTPVERVEIRLGEDNEILARGPNVFSGYYRNQEATDSVFTDGWFHTGDLGEMDEAGRLFIRGRKKDVIVTRDGLNIYPEDVEAAFNSLPGVREACVIGTGEDQSRLHAVLLLSDLETDPQAIRAQANELLPLEQRVETVSVWPEEDFPRTLTMKVKRRTVREAHSGADGSEAKESGSQATPLQRILGDLRQMNPESITPDLRLQLDLGLSSIDVVEFALRVEHQLHVEIDDTQLHPETTVGDIQNLIDAPRAAAPTIRFRRWTRALPFHLLRIGCEWLLLRPLLWLYCRKEVNGREHIRDLKGPLLVVSNHTSFIDTPLYQTILPARIGRRLCPAAKKEFFDPEPGASWLTRLRLLLSWEVGTIIFQIFPFPQRSGYRQSMAFAGEAIDNGRSILIFPEGRHITQEQLAEFAPGIGILWQGLRVPVLPVAIKGGAEALGEENMLPRRRTVRIAFGEPFLPDPSGSYEAVAKEIHDRIQGLHRGLK